MALYDDTPSDGVFRFYWADHEEFEYAYGPFDTAEAAFAAAQKESDEKPYGPEPGETIYVARADKRVTVPPQFDTEDLLSQYREQKFITFNSEHVLELFMEANEDCWGEDGWDGLTGPRAAEAETALIDALLLAVTNWVSIVKDDNDAEAEEALQVALQNAVRGWEVAYRDTIKVWMFGKMEEAVTYTIPELTPEALKERNILNFQRVTGLPREQVLLAMKGDAAAISAWLEANKPNEN